MMKKDFLKKAVGAFGATIAAVAIPALVANGTGMIQDPVEDPKVPYCLEVKPLSGSTYSGEAIYTDADGIAHSRGVYSFDLNIEEVNVDRYDKDGNFMKTDVVDSITSVTLKTISGNGILSEVYMPDTIAVTYGSKILKRTLTDLEFNYYTPEQGYTELNTFVDCEGLKHVYVAPSAKSVQWHGEDFLNLRNFHFRSEEVPAFNFSDGSNGTINIYVPEDLFAHYTEVIDGADYTATVWSEDPLSPVLVNVDVPGTLAEAVSSNIANLDKVRWLIITGTPDEMDLRMLRRLPRIEILDLSGTTGLTTISRCDNLKYLREVKLPNGLKEIGSSAFSGCTSLYDINIPSTVELINSSAFSGCTSLQSLVLPPSVTVIEGSAFQHCSSLQSIVLSASSIVIGDNAFNCSGLTSINLENVTFIADYAFKSTNLKSINLKNVRIIGEHAFQDCKALETVIFSEELTDIRDNAFENCNLNNTLKLPNSLLYLSGRSFANNRNITEVEIPSNVKSNGAWWGNAFDGCPLEKITIRILFPLEGSGFGGECANTPIYVPALTYNEYLLADGWVHLKNLLPLEEELDDIKIDRTFMLTSDRGIAKGAKVALDNGHLSVRRNINAPLILGKYYQSGRKGFGLCWTNEDYKYGYSYSGSTLIPYSDMTADEVELKMQLETGRWHFISLPFDVNVKDIKVTDETLWVVRKYSGADRAALNEKTWVNMTETDQLKAGEGYIFHCAHDNASNVEFTFTPASTESGNRMFAKDAVTHQLAEYPSEFAHNASWNLVGNTYPAYLNLRAVDFDGPVTVYNGGTYTAYSPVDDDFVFEPFQAFFVQRQDTEDGDKLTLKSEGRAHNAEEAAALSISRMAAPTIGNAANRALFDIHIAGENGADRARVVVNEAAAMAYEKNRDASKFMSSEKEVPQIFIMNDNRSMAIDERPLATGEVALGAYFGKKGEYTISLDTRNAEGYTVTLIDNKTGISTDLTAADYTFEADAATDRTRFTLVLNAQATAAEAIEATGVKISVEGNLLCITAPEEIEIAVVAADGKTVTSGYAARFEAVLEKGVYAVKAAGETKKIMIK